MNLIYKISFLGMSALALMMGRFAFADHVGIVDLGRDDEPVIIDLGPGPGHGGGGGGGPGGGGGHGGGGRPGGGGGHGGGGRPGGGGGHGGGGGGGPIILPVERAVLHCASGQYRYNECYVRGEIVHARLVQQVSAARCQEGRTFGFTQNSIWVDRGCRGNFEVYYQRFNRWDDADDVGLED